jgi:hypothetical protein
MIWLGNNFFPQASQTTSCEPVHHQLAKPVSAELSLTVRAGSNQPVSICHVLTLASCRNISRRNRLSILRFAQHMYSIKYVGAALDVALPDLIGNFAG